MVKKNQGRTRKHSLQKEITGVVKEVEARKEQPMKPHFKKKKRRRTSGREAR